MTTNDGSTAHPLLRVGSGRHRGARALSGIGAALIALSVLAVGCGGNDDASTTTTTAASDQEISDGGSSGSDGGPSSTIPVQTVPDDEFDQVIVDLQSKVDGAGDSCALLEVVVGAGNLPVPANATQTQQAAELLSGVLKRLGASPPPGQEAAGAALTTAADELLAKGEQSGWDPTTFGTSDTVSAEAQSALGRVAASCPNLGGGASTPPGGADTPG